MAESNSIECPRCSSKLKIKNPSIFGKKVRCPKCSESFLAESPPAIDSPANDEDAFLKNLESIGGDLGEPIESYRPPPQIRKRSAPDGKSDSGDGSGESRPKKKHRRSIPFGHTLPVMMWPLYGLGGGMVAGLIWITVGYFLHHEVGWIAWGVGVCVGVGVLMAAGDRRGPAAGLLGVAISSVVILVCKFAVAYLITAHFVAIATADMSETGVKLFLANTIAEEKASNAPKAGRGFSQTHDWGKYKTLEQFPREVRDETEERWQNMSDEDKDDIKRSMETMKKIPVVLTAIIVFFTSFSALDIVWFILAGMSAYRIGARGVDR